MSKPLVADELSSTSTRGCGSGASSSTSSATYTRCGAVLAGLGGERLDAGAEQHGLDLAAERRRLGEHAERALLQLALVVLEEDEELSSGAFRSCRNSTIFSAAEPSSSIFTVSPRAGGSLERLDLVREPASPASSAPTPRSASETVSCGFFFAPMIPLSDG